MIMADKNKGFKYKKLSSWIMANIKDGSFVCDEKIPSEAFLCHKFSLSRQTVRRAILELVNEGYLRSERGRGTFVAGQMQPDAHTVGVLMSYMYESLFVEMLRGMEEVLNVYGYDMDIGITNNRLNSEKVFLERMVESNIAGLIIEGTKSAIPNPNVRYLQKLKAKGVPIVFVHNSYADFPCCSITMDDEKLSYDMTQSLVAKGHRKIAGIFKGDDLQGVRRYKGYVEALYDSGIPVDENKIAWFYENYYDNEKLDTVMDEILDLLSEYTAIVVYNDFIAENVVKQLEKRGRSVPEDVSIVSFDNTFLAERIAGGLTSAAHPRKLLGIEAATQLVSFMENPRNRTTEREIVKTDIIEKNSVRNIE